MITVETYFVPEWQGGVNSNSAAGAVANASDGGYPFVNNGISQPGSGVHSNVQFTGMCRGE